MPAAQAVGAQAAEQKAVLPARPSGPAPGLGDAGRRLQSPKTRFLSAGRVVQLAFLHVVSPLHGYLFLFPPASSLLACFASLRVLVVNLPFILPVPSYLPLLVGANAYSSADVAKTPFAATMQTAAAARYLSSSASARFHGHSIEPSISNHSLPAPFAFLCTCAVFLPAHALATYSAFFLFIMASLLEH